MVEYYLQGFFSRLSKFGRVVFIKANWLRIVIVKQGSLPFKKPNTFKSSFKNTKNQVLLLIGLSYDLGLPKKKLCYFL